MSVLLDKGIDKFLSKARQAMPMHSGIAESTYGFVAVIDWNVTKTINICNLSRILILIHDLLFLPISTIESRVS